MGKRNTTALWIASAMLAYSLMLPTASGTDLDTKSSSKQQDEQQSESKQHKHSHTHSPKKMTSEDIKQMRLEKLQRMAQYFDISIEGKSLDQLRSEIEQAKKAQPQKWEAFKQQFRAQKLEKVRQYAKSKGITIEGKSLEQLHDELHELEERANDQ
jgi:transcriptional regulator of heat shock response